MKVIVTETNPETKESTKRIGEVVNAKYCDKLRSGICTVNLDGELIEVPDKNITIIREQ